MSGALLGHGDFRYRPVPGWGVLDARTPVNHCHGLAQDRAGHIYLLTDHTANNVIVYDRQGRLVGKWGTDLPGAHGLSLVVEGGREVLYLTCTLTHRVRKTTLDGTVLQEWGWPDFTGKYAQAKDYMPSWTLHHPDGSFYVLDGYGKDYILHYGADGTFKALLGGPEGGIGHWGPHGGHMDVGPDGTPALLIAMCDRQHLLRLSADGRILHRIDLPGGNPRMLRRSGSSSSSRAKITAWRPALPCTGQPSSALQAASSTAWRNSTRSGLARPSLSQSPKASQPPRAISTAWRGTQGSRRGCQLSTAH